MTKDHQRLGVTIGSGVLAVLAIFGIAHSFPAGLGGVSADSGRETPFPTYSSPAVTPMNLGATTTTKPSDEPTALPTSMAVPAVRATS